MSIRQGEGSGMFYKWKSLKLAALLAVLLVLSAPSYTVNAEIAADSQEQSKQVEEIEPPILQSEAAILIDARSGMTMYEKNKSEKLYPASITKIVTAIVAMEHSALSDTVTVSKAARWEEGTRVYLEEGEQMSMEQLLQGLMINSGNDAATAIAEHIDGSNEAFAQRMTAFVREKAGAMNSQFRNPHGLPDEEHYTTAEDMARIAQYAMRNEKFREIVGTKRVAWNGQSWQTTLVNHNKLLGSYEGATGIKNGYTQAAGSTLVASAERNGMELIAVILKAPTSNQLYTEMRSLLDYGFAAYEPKLLFDESETYRMNGMPAVSYIAEEPIWAVVPKGETPKIIVDTTGVVRILTSHGLEEAGRFQVSHEEAEVRTLAARVNAGEVSSMSAATKDGSNGAMIGSMIGLCLLAAIGIVLYRYRIKRKNNMLEP
ncbi:D-alanyl-D-alanine carboxypeptidase family protein [Paenibacillus xylaniclasticus]|uniref:D-alanyl-D-alanine carboxypeptidase family protein n=1 Tax=Paenibacillus xylaniclasticus TaxID=588083 RepID=UPI0017569A95|nr:MULTISPECIES: D-alanyl-D-alanine carboxypeptidase family protein [Paenibacillus]GFN30879.1 hypothetical protein PCURB6_11390 [Paenibacillus curdlanolyticus]